LGTIVIKRNEEEASAGPPKQQALLGVLAARAGEDISRDELIDAIWGQVAPVNARNNLHTYIADLRRRLGPGDRGTSLITRTSGYVLDIDMECLDSRRFSAQLTKARAAVSGGCLDSALAAYSACLCVWRGTAYMGVPGPFAELERVRLGESRLMAIQERLQVLLELHRYGEAMDHVTTLVRHHPLNEHLRVLQMIAFYRCGRQADAFRVFETIQRALALELGISPGHELRRCHEWMLRGDPSFPCPYPAVMLA
jgi:DNA-binding SARP family transcriptional activator